MEKQIDEILKVIYSASLSNSVTGGRTDYKTMPEKMIIKYGCSRINEAIALYKAGYRKQGEAEKQKLELWRLQGEIERLQSKINRLKKYDKERDIALHERLIANAKAEVAMEIFRELENHLKTYTLPVAKMGVIEIVKEPFLFIEPNDYAVLKKQYTEEKSE